MQETAQRIDPVNCGGDDNGGTAGSDGNGTGGNNGPGGATPAR